MTQSLLCTKLIKEEIFKHLVIQYIEKHLKIHYILLIRHPLQECELYLNANVLKDEAASVASRWRLIPALDV